MKQKNLILTAVVALFATMGTLNAQEKYAIIIGGNMNPGTAIPATEQWNGGNDPHPQHGFDEFWNDTYLQWEMLVIHKDYTDANVHVLFGDGDDFTFSLQDIRYKGIYHGIEYEVVTDASSNKQTISSTFAGLANTITDDDFLYIWIMSHGGTDGNGSYFYSYDNQKVYASELAALIGGIPAHKKVVVLSFPKSGGFLPVLEADDTIIITAGGATQGASVDEGFGREKRDEY
jgi:RNA binding exosome subunit